MAAPRDIVDSLESVVSVYFSGVRHNLRAAFILCDETVEVALRAKIKQTVHNLGRMMFHQLLAHAQVNLPGGAGTLNARLQTTRNTRNDMQHNNPAATVDTQHCADAILDAVACIDHCFPGASAAFEHRMRIAIRVIRLYSNGGNGRHRGEFERLMNEYAWRTDDRRPRRHESIIAPGVRRNWGQVMFDSSADIETILNQIGAP